MMKIHAVVVTYNRKALLTECLNAILHQTYPVSKILVINNASTDGTEKLFEEGGEFSESIVECHNMTSNLGGAGGFAEGVKLASKEDCDWVWIMDDDTIPEADALKAFMECSASVPNEKISFLASSVFGVSGEPMNVPIIDENINRNGYGDWYRRLEFGMVRIKAATFVSILVNAHAIKEVGIQFADYFLWGDDIEYTQRLAQYYGPAYMCGKSKVLHKRVNAKALSVLTEENKDRAKIYFYYYRNNLINCKAYNSKTELLNRVLRFEWKSIQTLYQPGVKYRWIKFCTVQKGIWDFLLRKYPWKKFEDRIGKID